LAGLVPAIHVKLLEANGFRLHRQGKGSHVIYRGGVAGKVMLVTAAAHRASDDIKPGTLAAMIRQSGLPKKLFR
jgi:predicted RNA binding protein YcfA (HicA-like mRNA interferase family)